ncbi:MAG: hypothetical protein M3P49_15905, partial [Actinomycetota bacterium]|nr:hypothetical protein [Actinomycetota bacterium]
MLLIGVFVGLPVWYVTGTDLSKVLAVSLALATLASLGAASGGTRLEAFFGMMILGLIVASLAWLLYGGGFFGVLVASFFLSILTLLVGVGERETRVHRPPSEEDGGGGERTIPLSPPELRALPYKEYLQTPHW